MDPELKSLLDWLEELLIECSNSSETGVLKVDRIVLDLNCCSKRFAEIIETLLSTEPQGLYGSIAELHKVVNQLLIVWERRLAAIESPSVVLGRPKSAINVELVSGIRHNVVAWSCIIMV